MFAFRFRRAVGVRSLHCSWAFVDVLVFYFAGIKLNFSLRLPSPVAIGAGPISRNQHAKLRQLEGKGVDLALSKRRRGACSMTTCGYLALHSRHRRVELACRRDRCIATQLSASCAPAVMFWMLGAVR